MTSREAVQAALEKPLSRRTLVIAGLLAAASTTSCMSNGHEGQGPEQQRGQRARAESSNTPGTPTTAKREGTPTAAPTETATAEAEPTPTPTPERRVPRIVGEELPVTWRIVDNPALAAALRKHGEDAKGDPTMEGVNGRKYRRTAAVIGVPLHTLPRGAALSVASVTQDPDDPRADRVSYAYIPKDELPIVTITDDRGDKVDAYSLRFRLGETPSALGFVSGEITPQKRSGWVAEPTRPINMNVDVNNGTYNNAPLV